MNVVLVDDEFFALQNLRIKLMEIGGAEIVGMYEDVDDFLHSVSEIRPDLVFLDVEMPKMNGFAVLDRILAKGLSPQIIFVTAYGQYAVKAFEIAATDYIVKPVDQERLRQSLDRAARSISASKQEEVRTPQNLRVNCFRTFSLVCGDADLSTGWKTKKAEELLAYLICEKGRFVTKERIAEDLWPEADGDKSLSNLHVAYYYLKLQEKQKGIDLLVESQRGKMRFRLEEAWCDLVEFDRLRERGLDQTVTSEARITFLEQAAERYAGPLLADRFYSWAFPLQQKYEIQREEILDLLIAYYRGKGDDRKADFYQCSQFRA